MYAHGRQTMEVASLTRTTAAAYPSFCRTSIAQTSSRSNSSQHLVAPSRAERTAIAAMFALCDSPESEKVQGATRLGATGPRASERKSASERVSEREAFRGFQRFSKVFRGLQRFLEVSEVFRSPLRDPLRGRFPLRGSRSCCP